MYILLGILSSLAVWQYAFASNCSLVQEEFCNGIRNSSTGYRLRGDFYKFEYYIPQCTAGGLFEKIQCTTLNQSVPIPSYYNPPIRCWCVDPVTGISVDYSTVSGPKNASECDNTINVNTTALCGEGQFSFTFFPGACSFYACFIGPPLHVAFTGECDSYHCPALQMIVWRPIPHGCGCEDYTCGDMIAAVSATFLVAFVLVVIVIIVAVVVICCVVCKKPKVTQPAHPVTVAASNVHFTVCDEKVDIPGDDQA